MSDGREPKLRDDVEGTDPAVPGGDPTSTPDGPLSPEQLYVKRKAEVLRQDNESFAYVRGDSPPSPHRRSRPDRAHAHC